MLTRQGEIRQDHARQMCLQPHGLTGSMVNCALPRAPIPYAQKWTITMVRMFAQRMAVVHEFVEYRKIKL